MRSLFALVFTFALLDCTAAEASDPQGATRPLPPDPSSQVIAEGHYRYRQRDVDALTLVARRHLGRPFIDQEEKRTRTAIAQLLVAREALLAARTKLPASLTASQRDRLLLDILDYDAEAIDDAVADIPAVAAAIDHDELQLSTIPTINLRRDIDGTAWQLAIDISLLATRPAGDLTPLIQDALLTHLHELDTTAFTGLTPRDFKPIALRALQDIPLNIAKVLVTGLDVSREE